MPNIQANESRVIDGLFFVVAIPPAFVTSLHNISIYNVLAV